MGLVAAHAMLHEAQHTLRSHRPLGEPLCERLRPGDLLGPLRYVARQLHRLLRRAEVRLRRFHPPPPPPHTKQNPLRLSFQTVEGVCYRAFAHVLRRKLRPLMRCLRAVGERPAGARNTKRRGKFWCCLLQLCEARARRLAPSPALVLLEQDTQIWEDALEAVRKAFDG
ncbi:hypothetical protein STCU_11928 [Strigomonas culicis]|uniref:Uncharacterized protein n=1 Tax=Strigomonas culicis TaxID=28005 RepID=S9TF70_9TRYP|nr:hypothetical protein STCU_11928 [Strigomonas culicis]|eukprot:EPY15564.1 hypothetical protein STCU_11928 [Strigomonas culicis]